MTPEKRTAGVAQWLEDFETTQTWELIEMYSDRELMRQFMADDEHDVPL